MGHIRWFGRATVIVATLATVGFVIVPNARSVPGTLQGAAAQVVTTPEVTVVPSDASASEAGLDPGEFTFSRTGATDAALTVSYVVAGTASAGTDYAALSGSIEIPSGHADASVAVTPIQDSVFEGSETVTLTIVDGAAYDLGDPHAATVTITDDDLPHVTVNATQPNASETGPTTGTFTLYRTGSTASTLTVTFGLTGTASAGDYTASPSGTVTFGAGSSTATVLITPTNDAIAETTETVTLTIVDGAAYDVDAPASATVQITDNDAVLVTVVATDPNAAEAGPDTGTFTLYRTGSTASTLTVTFGLTGTASAGDYTASPSGTVTFGAGSSTATVLITPTNDAIAETTETVTLTIVDGAAYDVGAPASATVQITDNDGQAPTPRTDPKDVCKKGGWKTFKVFKNQGDCVSYIATGGKNPPALGPAPVGLLP